jgi:hypothetical protein
MRDDATVGLDALSISKALFAFCRRDAIEGPVPVMDLTRGEKT